MLDRVATGIGHRDRGQTVLSGEVLELERRLDHVFTGWARTWNAVEYRFPACVEARHLERLDYFRSFPHLATFPVTLARDEGNIETFASGEALSPEGRVQLPELAGTEHVLTPAACYHVYVELEGETLAAPRYVTTRATCFRNEDAYAPLERQWNFSMREIVCLGTAAEIEDFIARSTDVVSHFVRDIDLPVEWADATDPFFALTRNPKYLFQKAEPVKRELVYGEGLAIASTNFHRDYFGEAFRIARGGEAAFSGCVAFGMERWLAALLDAFGPEPSDWPDLDGYAP